MTIFADWHVRPHWTKAYSQVGHVAMWGRTMPGTKRLILNGPQGRLLGGWNYPIDTHMTHILVDLEAALECTLDHPIGCTIMDSEAVAYLWANGMPQQSGTTLASSLGNTLIACRSLSGKVAGNPSKMTLTGKRFSLAGRTPSVLPRIRADLC